MLSTLASEPVTIHPPAEFDAKAFRAFVDGSDRLFGLDVESHPIFSRRDAASAKLDPLNMYGNLRDRWLRLVQVATSTEAYNLDPRDPRQRAALMWLFKDKRNRFTSQTAIDPVVVLVCLGVDITARYYDTLTLMLLLEPGDQDSHGLKDVTARYGMPELSNAEDKLKDRFEALKVKAPSRSSKRRHKGETPEDHRERLAADERAVEAYLDRFPMCGWNGWRDTPLDDPTYQEYGGLDAIAVRRVYPMLIAACKEWGIPADTIRNELWLQQWVARRQVAGMPVDRAYADSLMADYGALHLAARQEFVELTGYTPGQTARVVEWLQGQGIEFTAYTDPTTDHPNGQPSLKQIHIDDLIIKYSGSHWHDQLSPQGHQALAIMKRFAETKNLYTFVSDLLRRIDQDGRVHPNIRALGAETGRWTVNQPAVQTLSNRNPVRGCFVPSLPTNVLVSIDLSQIEVRIAASLSGETTLIQAFNRGEDAYNAVAEMIFGPGFTKDQRSMAKRVVLATLYGAGVDTIVRQLHDLDHIVADPETIGQVRRDFRRAYRRITEFGRKVNTGEDVWLYSGRYVPGDPEKNYRGINSACQGSGRDILMDIVRRIAQAGHEDAILMTIHDEILFDLPEKGLRAMLLELKALFEVPFGDVKVAVDIEIYPERWGVGMLLPCKEGLCRKVKEDVPGMHVRGKEKHVLTRQWQH